VKLRVFLFAALAACALAVPASAAGPMYTGISDLGELDGPNAALAVDRMRAAGSTFVRTQLTWSEVAPNQPANAADPADPAYTWTVFDKRLQLIKAHGLEPIVTVFAVPRWASFGADPTPDITALSQFLHAAALRYSGRYQGLPHIRYWEIWNEPNASRYLAPVFKNKKPWSPGYYRRMVNAAADAIHSVRPDDDVIAGAFTPFTRRFKDFVAIGPLKFMAQMLCMSLGPHPHPTCSAKMRFDIISTHPYTSGGPTHHAQNPDDVSLGDLPKMRRLLDASVKAGKIVSNRRVRFWVTEFSWDSAPPDPTAVPMKIHARWTSQALYVMWKSGINVCIWLQLRDVPIGQGFNQGGLYFDGKTFASDKPKLSLEAFRFPFVAFRHATRATVWGRTPKSRPAVVSIQQRTRTGWHQLARLRANRYGIFQGSVALRGETGSLEARIARDRSVPFSLKPVKDFFINPFGDK
jgi:Cellulase (glycosyl hydrolase family 5)